MPMPVSVKSPKPPALPAAPAELPYGALQALETSVATLGMLSDYLMLRDADPDPVEPLSAAGLGLVVDGVKVRVELALGQVRQAVLGAGYA